jgi:hypothetical protein
MASEQARVKTRRDRKKRDLDKLELGKPLVDLAKTDELAQTDRKHRDKYLE